MHGGDFFSFFKNFDPYSHDLQLQYLVFLTKPANDPQVARPTLVDNSYNSDFLTTNKNLGGYMINQHH